LKLLKKNLLIIKMNKMNKIKKIYQILLNEHGKQGWWPAKSNNKKFEIIIGAILTQNTAWRNVEISIKNLAKNNLIDINKIKKINSNKLKNLIKSSGFFNQKAERLKIIANHLSNYKNLNEFFKRPGKEIRQELLSIKGIGHETADSILLYAGSKPFFVIDAYTRRIFYRFGICNENIEYEDLQNLFIQALPKSIRLYKEYHALLDETAKKYCKKNPLCFKCPLKKYCKKKK